MKNIKELITIADKQKANHPHIVNGHHSNNNKQTQLYHLINNHDDEDVIAQQLYGPMANASYQAYVKLKSRLKQNLLHSLFFFEPPEKNKKLMLNAYKNVYLAKILHYLHADKLADKTYQKGIVAAQQTEQFDLILEAARQMAQLASKEGDTTLFSTANSCINQYTPLCELKNEMQHKLCEVQLLLGKTPSINGSVKFIDQVAAKFNDSRNASQYFSLVYLYHRLLDAKYKSIDDHHSVISNGLEARKRLLKFEFVSKEEIFYYTYSCLEAYHRTQRFKEGNEFIASLKSKLNKHVLNAEQLVIEQYAMTYLLGLCQFQDAKQKGFYFLKSRSFKKLSGKDKVLWKLYQSYANIGKQLTERFHKIDPVLNKPVAAGKLKSKLSEFSSLEKDKHGFNNSIIILKVLMDIVNNDYGAIVDRIDSIKVYRARYLRKGFHKRLYNFIGILLYLEKYSFNTAKTEEKCYSILEELKNNPEDHACQEYEIIPFHDLWEMIKHKIN